MNRHQLRRHWRPILLAALCGPACLSFAVSSGCAETKARKVTFEEPERQYGVRTIA